MATVTIAPYGSWRSPLSAERIAAGSIRCGQLRLEDGAVYWTESRPTEGGRNTLVRWDGQGSTEITKSPFNVRSGVHEYGGMSHLTVAGVCYFCHYADQRIYQQHLDGEAFPLTAALPRRYADLVFDAPRQRLICVCETHGVTGQPVNTIQAISLDDPSSAYPLAAQHDFYASPKISPDGTMLAWISWDHPNMPWDGTELWLGNFAEDGRLVDVRKVAGGPEEAIFQPEWSPDGTLYYVSDVSGWWNLYRLRQDQSEPVLPRAAEFGQPHWVFGTSTYGFASADQLICAYAEQGVWHLAALDTRSGAFAPISQPYTELAEVRVEATRVVFLGASPQQAQSVVQLDLASGACQVLQAASDIVLEEGYCSPPEAVEYSSLDGETAYGFLYRPKNADYQAPLGELPPLLLKSHGGPTSATSNAFRPWLQYWTSRGFAVLDVNYGGSTGYGRAYRQRLAGRWGIVDVADCVQGARYLVEQGVVDAARLAITGGSAGGYTTLCALTFEDIFSAGASHYGVSDLEALAADTHKFESRYLDRLVGPYPAERKRYQQRSPIHATEKLSCPLIFFQGLEDRIVPPNQAEEMVKALTEKGIPVAYLPFPGEQHGFRQAKNMRRALEAEFYFYAQVFAFEVAEEIEPVEIFGWAGPARR